MLCCILLVFLLRRTEAAATLRGRDAHTGCHPALSAVGEQGAVCCLWLAFTQTLFTRSGHVVVKPRLNQLTDAIVDGALGRAICGPAVRT